MTAKLWADTHTENLKNSSAITVQNARAGAVKLSLNLVMVCIHLSHEYKMLNDIIL